MRHTFLFTALLTALVAIFPTATTASTDNGPAELFEAYETIRQVLLHDTIEGIGETAREVQDLASELAEQATSADPVLFGDLGDTAEAVAASEDLDGAREAFSELSKAMVRYRESVSGARPLVAYCSMAKKSWLQPEGEIGNPYYGQEMARCGEVVSPADDGESHAHHR